MDLLNSVMSQGDVDHRTELHEELRELRYAFHNIQSLLSQNEENCGNVLSDTVGCMQLAPKRMDSDTKKARYMYTVLTVVRGEQRMTQKVQCIIEQIDKMTCKLREIQASIAMGSVLSKST
jgi:hypothetical protein